MVKDNIKLQKAKTLAKEIIEDIQPYCKKIKIAGSIRRKNNEVGDIELVAIPKKEKKEVKKNLFDKEIKETCLLTKYIDTSDKYTKRKNKKGQETFGEKNKLLIYKNYKLDLFSCCKDNWTMIYFIRTGGYKNNIIVASRANELGYSLKMYKNGFELPDGSIKQVKNEKEIFDFLNLKYIKPENRE